MLTTRDLNCSSLPRSAALAVGGEECSSAGPTLLKIVIGSPTISPRASGPRAPSFDGAATTPTSKGLRRRSSRELSTPCSGTCHLQQAPASDVRLVVVASMHPA